MMIDPKQLAGATPQEIERVKANAHTALNGIAPSPVNLGRTPPAADLPGLKRFDEPAGFGKGAL